jgi:ClpP class serine protease
VANVVAASWENVLFTSGEQKGAGFPGTSLTEAQREHVQAQVDEAFNMFKAAVWTRRPGIDESSMEGQTFMGLTALGKSLADQVVDGFEEVMRDAIALTKNG